MVIGVLFSRILAIGLLPRVFKAKESGKNISSKNFVAQIIEFNQIRLNNQKHFRNLYHLNILLLKLSK